LVERVGVAMGVNKRVATVGEKQEETAIAASDTMADDVATPRAKGKRRKVSKEAIAVDEPCPVVNDRVDNQRKIGQRAIQKLVSQMRVEGKTDREIQLAKRELKAQTRSMQPQTSKKAQKTKEWQEWATSKEGQDERKKKLDRKHELVVIPVVWRGRQDKDDIVRMAEDIKACVAQQGVDVWVDSRRQYSPGQKFAHWEHRGVMLRIEVGPEDIKAGVCRVCLAKTPGDYKSVQKKQVRLPPAGTRSLLLALKEWGLSKIEIERREGDSADEEDGAQAVRPVESSQALEGVAPTAGVDDVQGNWMPPESAIKKFAATGGKKKKKVMNKQ